MEERYKMALEAILTLIENDNYADKKVIKAICKTALMYNSLLEEESEDKEV